MVHQTRKVDLFFPKAVHSMLSIAAVKVGCGGHISRKKQIFISCTVSKRLLLKVNKSICFMLMVVHGRKLETSSAEETRLVLVKMRFFVWAASYFRLIGKNRAINMVQKIMEDIKMVQTSAQINNMHKGGVGKD